MKIKLKNGRNIYQVRIDEQFALLECIEYYQPEDLGDGIVCDHLGKETWIAYEFHKWMYETC